MHLSEPHRQRRDCCRVGRHLSANARLHLMRWRSGDSQSFETFSWMPKILTIPSQTLATVSRRAVGTNIASLLFMVRAFFLKYGAVTALIFHLVACGRSTSSPVAMPQPPSHPELDNIATQIEQQNETDFRKMIAWPIDRSRDVGKDLDRIIREDQSFHAHYPELRQDLTTASTWSSNQIQQAVNQLTPEFHAFEANQVAWSTTSDALDSALDLLQSSVGHRLKQCENGPSAQQIANTSNPDYLRQKFAELCQEHTRTLLGVANCQANEGADPEICGALTRLREAEQQRWSHKILRDQVTREREEIRNEYFSLSRRLNSQNP